MNKKIKEKTITCPECKYEMTERGFRYIHVERSHKMNYFDFMLKHGETLEEGKHYVVCQNSEKKRVLDVRARLFGGSFGTVC